MAALTKETPILSPRKLRDDLYLYPYQQNSSNSTPLVISVIASLMERAVARNERIARNFRGSSSLLMSKDVGSTAAKVFECHEAPDMKIQSYLERIFRYTKIGPSVYVVAYVYIDRFCQLHPTFRIAPTNVHRLLITSIRVASKCVEDMNYRNSYFARVGGLTTMEMNKLEVEFLFLMGFKLHVNVSVFQSYCCHLEREVSFGGGYQIERTLRCAQQLKSKQSEDTRCSHITSVLL